MSRCPTREQLECLFADESSPSDLATIAAHVEDCPQCHELLARLTDDPDLERWRELLRKTSQGLLPDTDFLQRLKDSPPDPPGPEPGEEVSEPIRFPGAPTSKGPLGQLGPYHIRRELAAGGFGFLYEAVDSLDRAVAVKVLRPELAASAQHRARFDREVRTAAAIRHENIVTIFEVGDTPDFPLPYFVMEYVDGEALNTRLEQTGSPAPADAARIVREVALGLAEAHRQGVVHRDIKPRNIMLERATGRVKITDFGLARSMIEETGDGISESGRMIGTPAYMSPEQITAPGSVDQRTDIYSLGVVLYELLTGQRPFLGTQQKVIEHIIHDDPRPPRRVNKAIPRDLETICLKAMEKHPDRRYQTAAALADDLQRALRGEPIAARPVAVWERAIKWARRRRAVTALLAALFLVTIGAFAAITWKWREAEHRREQAEHEKDRADRNFNYARQAVEETADKLLANQQFREGPFQGLHDDLLTSAIDFYEDMVQQRGDDPSLDADRGRAYWRRGFVRSMRNRHELALTDYRHMEEVFRGLTKRVPDNPGYRRWLAWSLCSQGNMLRDLGRHGEAEPMYGQALRMLEDLVARHSGKPEFVVSLGATRMNRGKLAHRLGQLDDALAWHNRARELLEPLAVTEGEVGADRVRFLRETYQDQADVLIQLRRWPEAATTLRRLADVQPDHPRHWYDCAIAHLGADDLEGYRAICRQMFDRFGKTQDPQIAERLLYACVAAPEAVSDLSRLVPLAEHVATTGRWNQRLLGASLCRAGRPNEAVSCFETAAQAGSLRGWDLFFLAMAHHRAGNAAKGGQFLAQAQSWLDETLRADPLGTGKRWGWTERVETEQLRREAENVVVAAGAASE